MKKIVIIEKNHNYWKRLWLLKKIMIIEKDCDYWKRLWQDKFSSNINEVIRPVLNFLFFFYDKISQVQKSTKRIQGTKKH